MFDGDDTYYNVSLRSFELFMIRSCSFQLDHLNSRHFDMIYAGCEMRLHYKKLDSSVTDFINSFPYFPYISPHIIKNMSKAVV